MLIIASFLVRLKSVKYNFGGESLKRLVVSGTKGAGDMKTPRFRVRRRDCAAKHDYLNTSLPFTRNLSFVGMQTRYFTVVFSKQSVLVSERRLLSSLKMFTVVKDTFTDFI